ncbi:hypothetical protein DFH28DRAFT_114902 [Melampsora americana]|nr:hypothetical protein DFH28DRAFT_114902 [Melampsora americana]
MTTPIITPEERLHQQLMGRSNSHLNLVDPSHQIPINPSHRTTIIDSLGQTYSSPYHSANALISSSSNLSLQSNRPPSRHHSINPSPTPSQSNLNRYLGFDPDREAELVRRRKLEARRSMSSTHPSLKHATSRASFSVAPRTRRQSSASSIASNATSPLPQQRTLSPQPQARRLLVSGSPLTQVHRPSPLRSASTPTLNLSENEHDPSETPPPVPTLSKRSQQKLMKAEQRKIKKELIESERVRLNIPERRRSIWFNTTGSSNPIEKENKPSLKSKPSSKKTIQEERDPFRKSMLQIDGESDSVTINTSSSPNQSHQGTPPPSDRKQSKKKKTTASTLSRLFGTLLSTHNHPKSISVVDARSPILSTPHSNHKRMTVMESIKRTTKSKRRAAVPVFDQSMSNHPQAFVPSGKPSESLEQEDESGESVPRIGNVRSGNGVMVLVVDSH